MKDCFEKGGHLQNKLWDVLERSRFYPEILCTDIEIAFLQKSIPESKRDCLRFHWVEATNNDKTEIYRFARLVFELTQSLFKLEETLDAHFNNCGQEFQKVVEKAREYMYVNDLVTGEESKRNKIQASPAYSFQVDLSYISRITMKQS